MKKKSFFKYMPVIGDWESYMRLESHGENCFLTVQKLNGNEEKIIVSLDNKKICKLINQLRAIHYHQSKYIKSKCKKVDDE